MSPQPKPHKKFKARLGTDPGNSKIQGSMLDHPSLRQNSPGIITITITIQTRILSKIFYNGEKTTSRKHLYPTSLGSSTAIFHPLGIQHKPPAWTSQHPQLDASQTGRSDRLGTPGMPPALATLPCGILSPSATPSAAAWPGHVCSSCSSFC